MRTVNIGTMRFACERQKSRWRDDPVGHLLAWFGWDVVAWDRALVVHAVRREPEQADDLYASSVPSTQHARSDGKVDEQQFELFFLKYQHEIFGYLWRITGEEQAARDLCQEAFLRAWQQFGKVAAYDRPSTWLFRVATNLAINYKRHRTRVSSRLQALDENDAVETDPALYIVEQDAVSNALLALPVRQRAALILRVIHGMSTDDIALMLNISPAAARMMLSRAREQFRRQYGSVHHTSRQL